jgi:hypothetical protein
MTIEVIRPTDRSGCGLRHKEQRMITITSKDFNQDAGRAKRAATDGPVFITDRGKPAHVLLSIDDYSKLAGIRRNAVELPACRETENFDFEPENLQRTLFKAVEF